LVPKSPTPSPPQTSSSCATSAGCTPGLRRSLCLIAVSLVAGFALQSCARPPKPRAPALYESLRESLAQADTAALRGVKIVIDPGHGGPYDGALGPHGLREADVNLGVALQLWGLLTDAGADATLTRTTDAAVSRDEGTSLRDDLRERARIANEADADLFLSIHHNSDLTRDPALNRIETYHKVGDGGPSEDAARAIHSHLSYNIGETRGGVIAGNYMVLRTCERPAVLAEPSFISNPAIEEKLADVRVQRMEAAACFLGIADYFSRGVPRLERLAPRGSETADPRPTIVLKADPGRGAALNPSSAEILLDGRPLVTHYSRADSTVEATPEGPLPGGEHEVRARVRNNRGNWSRWLEFEFTVVSVPAHIVVAPQTRRAPWEGIPYPIEASVYDANMNPVADGVWVSFTSTRPAFPESALVESGTAVCYVLPGPSGTFEIEARCGKASAGFAADPGASAAQGRAWWAFLRDESDGSPVAGAEVEIDGEGAGVSNRDGFVAVPVPDGQGHVWRIGANGYEWRPGEMPEPARGFWADSTSAEINVVRMARAAGGLLHGLVFALDPEGGGDDRAGQGPSGTDASWVNYEVAAALADMIERSGGRVVLTRRHGEAASGIERVLAAEAAGAARYLLLSHRPQGEGGRPTVGHYPGSATGADLARAISSAASLLLPGEAPAVSEDARYVLRQSSSPAVSINLMPLEDHETERFFSRPWNVQREAYAVYAGLLTHLDTSGSLAPGKLAVQATLPGGDPAEGVTFTVDGYLELAANEEGEAEITALKPGPHSLEAALEGYRTAFEEFSWPPAEGRAVLTTRLAAAH